MDDVNRFARELADAIAAAAADHPKVEACRERARAAGYEMRVTLEAIVGFASRDKNAPLGSPARKRLEETLKQVEGGYLFGYRDRGIFYEHVTNVILDEITSLRIPAGVAMSAHVDGDHAIGG